MKNYEYKNFLGKRVKLIKKEPYDIFLMIIQFFGALIAFLMIMANTQDIPLQINDLTFKICFLTFIYSFWIFSIVVCFQIGEEDE